MCRPNNTCWVTGVPSEERLADLKCESTGNDRPIKRVYWRCRIRLHVPRPLMKPSPGICFHRLCLPLVCGCECMCVCVCTLICFDGLMVPRFAMRLMPRISLELEERQQEIWVGPKVALPACVGPCMSLCLCEGQTVCTRLSLCRCKSSAS